jgi:hypothetical protein
MSEETLTTENVHAQGGLLTVKDFSKKHNWPIGGLRHLLFQKPQGFEKVIRKVGRKVLLHETAFFQWVEAINQKKNGGRREY